MIWPLLLIGGAIVGFLGAKTMSQDQQIKTLTTDLEEAHATIDDLEEKVDTVPQPEPDQQPDDTYSRDATDPGIHDQFASDFERFIAQEEGRGGGGAPVPGPGSSPGTGGGPTPDSITPEDQGDRDAAALTSRNNEQALDGVT